MVNAPGSILSRFTLFHNDISVWMKMKEGNTPMITLHRVSQKPNDPLTTGQPL